MAPVVEISGIPHELWWMEDEHEEMCHACCVCSPDVSLCGIHWGEEVDDADPAVEVQCVVCAQIRFCPLCGDELED